VSEMKNDPERSRRDCMDKFIDDLVEELLSIDPEDLANESDDAGLTVNRAKLHYRKARLEAAREGVAANKRYQESKKGHSNLRTDIDVSSLGGRDEHITLAARNGGKAEDPDLETIIENLIALGIKHGDE